MEEGVRKMARVHKNKLGLTLEELVEECLKNGVSTNTSSQNLIALCDEICRDDFGPGNYLPLIRSLYEKVRHGKVAMVLA